MKERLTKKVENGFYELTKGNEIYGEENGIRLVQIVGQLEDIEKELGIDLIEFFKGEDPDTILMEITEDKEFFFSADSYYGVYDKENLLKLIRQLLFMYWMVEK